MGNSNDMKPALRLSFVMESLDERNSGNRHIAKIVKTAIPISAQVNCNVRDILYVIVLIPFLVSNNKICESTRIPYQESKRKFCFLRKEF